MIALGPVAHARPASNDIRFEYPASVKESESPAKQPNVTCPRRIVDPPEMPDAVKAQALKGMMCYYGFYFPDEAVDAFNKAHKIDCPSGSDLREWIGMRKRKVLNDVSLTRGIQVLTTLTPSRTHGHDDIVFFAYSKGPKFAKLMCPPEHVIKELMAALGVEGEPQWIVD